MIFGMEPMGKKVIQTCEIENEIQKHELTVVPPCVTCNIIHLTTGHAANERSTVDLYQMKKLFHLYCAEKVLFGSIIKLHSFFF